MNSEVMFLLGAGIGIAGLAVLFSTISLILEFAWGGWGENAKRLLIIWVVSVLTLLACGYLLFGSQPAVGFS